MVAEMSIKFKMFGLREHFAFQGWLRLSFYLRLNCTVLALRLVESPVDGNTALAKDFQAGAVTSA